MRNTIILTHGWSGSSVLAGLIGRAGAWLGEETMAKPDYDTFENTDLIDLNKDLMERFAPALNYEHDFKSAHVSVITEGARAADLSKLRSFVEQCGHHRPWLWKDPRLTWTIRVWADLLDLSNTRFVVLTRETTQAWIGANLRRHIQSFAFTRAYNDGVTQSNTRFLNERGLPYLSLSFEDLLLAPDRTLERLNGHLDVALTREDLRTVCKLPLGRRNRGFNDFFKAAAIYAKNYRERDGRARSKHGHGVTAGSPTVDP
jgi:hypothetical protein